MSAKSEICISYFRFQTLFLTSSPPTGNTDLKTLNVINAFKLTIYLTCGYVDALDRNEYSLL